MSPKLLENDANASPDGVDPNSLSSKFFFARLAMWMYCCECMCCRRKPEKSLSVPLRSCKLLVLGIDGAGKTSLLLRTEELGRTEPQKIYALPLPNTVVPTTGFSIKQTVSEPFRFDMWEIGGAERVQPHWHRYASDVRGLIFVVDASDRKRIGEASLALRDFLRNVSPKWWPTVILVNKSDVPGALSVSEVEAALDLGGVRPAAMAVFAASALPSGARSPEESASLSDELAKGLNWMAKALS